MESNPKERQGRLGGLFLGFQLGLSVLRRKWELAMMPRQRKGEVFLPGMPRNAPLEGVPIAPDGFPPHYELFRYRDKLWYWRLWSAAGDLIAEAAQGYDQKSECLASITLVKATADAPVWHLSEMDPARDPPFSVL